MDELVEIKTVIEPDEKMVQTRVKHVDTPISRRFDWSVQVDSWDDLRNGVCSYPREARDDLTVWKTSVTLFKTKSGGHSLEIGGRFGIGEPKYNATVRTYLARPDGVIVSGATRYNDSLEEVQDTWTFGPGGLDKEFPEKSFIIRHVVDGTETTKETVTTPLIE